MRVILALLACGLGGAESPPAGDSGEVADTGEIGGSAAGGDTGETAPADDSGEPPAACAGEGAPVALFTLEDGSVVDLSETFRAGAPGASIDLSLPEPGVLEICPGQWFVTLRVEAELAIRGAGPEQTVLDAAGAAAVIRARGAIAFSVTGLTLRGGYSQHGGGLYATGGVDVRVEDCVIEASAVWTDGHGGGMCVSERSAATLSGVTFRDNLASEGGGLAVMDSEVVLSEVRFEGNRAEGEHFPGYGGGLYMEGSWGALSGLSFEGNAAAASGGGMALWYDSEATLDGALFAANTSGDDGGGLHLLFGDLSLSDATLSGNTAAGSGGGAALKFSTLSLRDVALQGNTAAELGGGLYLDGDSAASGRSCTFTDNEPSDLYAADYGDIRPGADFDCDAERCP